MAWKPASRSTATPERRREIRRQHDRYRGSARQRGYDATWDAFSVQVREEFPLCLWCLDRGIVTPSKEVHHLQKLADHPELKYEPSNVVAICSDCHRSATARGE